ncbi:1,4-alpha-glucan branching protein [Streptomyces sp. JV185]|uniref:maltokinase N-terminal cap-like domain-containing protein n=1 Tax=Streptomyces sp. JV185 TaxID=858638 RepID=UPI002E799E93|nr:1,4-alpha-glucan branching protein [Streptomyces sp. JV185]MEE1768038.1 1,4-alpha-glucan branching protein [Streptomyces sp. JV185]
MAVIHRTTLTPTKLELLATWLPAQPWYRSTGQQPELDRTGGFRLDDPKGEVGIEFMVVTDISGAQPATYQVLFSYRDAPLAGADDALIGTTEHGVLGHRWVYDGAHDPVVVAQLFALLAGEAEPQMQSTSDTPDPSVTARLDASGITAELASFTTAHSPDGTEILVTTASGRRGLALHLNRVLQPGQNAGSQALGHVTAPAPLPDGTPAPTEFVVVHAHP